MEGAYGVLVRKPEWKLARPSVDGVIILICIFNKLNVGVDWIYLAHDKDKRRILLRTAWRTVSLSRRSQLYGVSRLCWSGCWMENLLLCRNVRTEFGPNLALNKCVMGALPQLWSWLPCRGMVGLSGALPPVPYSSSLHVQEQVKKIFVPYTVDA